MLINVSLWKEEKAKQTKVVIIVQKYILELIKYSVCSVHTGKVFKRKTYYSLDKSEEKCNTGKLFFFFFWEIEEYQHYVG